MRSTRSARAGLSLGNFQPATEATGRKPRPCRVATESSGNAGNTSRPKKSRPERLGGCGQPAARPIPFRHEFPVGNAEMPAHPKVGETLLVSRLVERKLRKYFVGEPILQPR